MTKIYTKATNNINGFVKTNEKIEITFNGWDGKSYDGEARKMNVWVCDKYPDKKFVYTRSSFLRIGGSYKVDCFHIVTNNMIIEKATGIAHPEVSFYTDYDVDYIMA